jgi:hypothetical protein
LLSGGLTEFHARSVRKEEPKIGWPVHITSSDGRAFGSLWLLPFWALTPYIEHSLQGLSNPPSVAAVTTAIVVIHTILELLGFGVAGTEVKSIIKGSTMLHTLRKSGPYFWATCKGI